MHNVTTEFAWIHHPPYRFSHLLPFPLADNVSHYFTKGSTKWNSYHINFHFNDIIGNRLLFNNMEINKSLEKISLLN